MSTDDVAHFHHRVADALQTHRWRKLVLAAYRGDEPGLVRLVVRPVELRGAPHASFVWSYAQRDVTKNHPAADALELLRPWIGPGAFAHAHLLTADEDVELRYSRRGEPRLTTSRAPASLAPPAGHNREKQHALHLGLPFLAELGIATPDGRLVPTMARKWRQINKFVEIVDHALDAAPIAPGAPLRIADFGCGKGYLTFALHHHLSANRGRQVQTTGVDLKAEVVAHANAVAERLGIAGLAFETGDVSRREPAPLDVMIALHACDTATDHAIHFGLRSGAALIVCAPCCHKQLRPQMTALPAPLAPMLRHGVHLGQQAEMLTDTLRALLLQAHGYDTQVFEFVATEHTQKNKMILATKRAQPLPAGPLLAQVGALKDFYAVREHCLETLLAERTA
jgi:trans-aconitate methyltransferase